MTVNWILTCTAKINEQPLIQFTMSVVVGQLMIVHNAADTTRSFHYNTNDDNAYMKIVSDICSVVK